jgi:hypothetical protein
VRCFQSTRSESTNHSTNSIPHYHTTTHYLHFVFLYKINRIQLSVHIYHHLFSHIHIQSLTSHLHTFTFTHTHFHIHNFLLCSPFSLFHLYRTFHVFFFTLYSWFVRPFTVYNHALRPQPSWVIAMPWLNHVASCDEVTCRTFNVLHPCSAHNRTANKCLQYDDCPLAKPLLYDAQVQEQPPWGYQGTRNMG